MKKLLYICIVYSCLLNSYTSKAQLLQAGDAVVTMSGNLWTNNTPPPPQAPVLEIFRTKNTAAAPIGSGWAMTPGFYATYSYIDPTWTRANMGNIFGIAIDNNRNIYTTATGFYGSQVAGISTGQIWKIDGVTGAVTAFKDLHTAGQDQKCLGNIKFFNGFLYVSDLKDGNIYAVDVSNSALNFPPFDPGGAADNRKPHGLAIRNVGGNPRLFYSLNNFNSTTTAIHSIGIAGSNFTGVETVELTNFAVNTNPVTDIAFSKDYARMILAERTTQAWTSTSAHSSRVLEYKFNGVSWIDQLSGYLIGGSSAKNAAGGISFSQIVLQSNNVAKCDTTIWATSDYLITTPGPFYGMVGFKHATGAGTPTGINIDFDNNWAMNSWDKTFLGDVEVCDTTVECSNCNCGAWAQNAFSISNPANPAVLLKPCGSSHSFITGQVSGFLNANYSCIGECNKTFSWQLINATTNAQIATGTTFPINLSQYNNLPCAGYKFIVTPKCGDKTCPPCEFLMNIVCNPPSCCPQQTQVSIEPQNANYTSSNNPNAWGIYSQQFTLNSNVQMSEIRINVEHFELNSPDPDCIPCKNVPKTWGSLLSAAYNGNGFTKPINSLPFNNSQYSNGRELIYKPGTLITINNGVVNVNVAMPNASPIECCVLTAKLCLKFTFKDANCRECTYIYCNEKIEIEKSKDGNPNGNQLKQVNKKVEKTVF